MIFYDFQVLYSLYNGALERALLAEKNLAKYEEKLVSKTYFSLINLCTSKLVRFCGRREPSQSEFVRE